MLPDLAWAERAACRDVDPELFFVGDGRGEMQHQLGARAAYATCMRCPVLRDCREWVDHTEAQIGTQAPLYGIYAGETGLERRRRREQAHV